MARHPWNLNVLPKRDASLFHHTTEVIHGVTDPMLYFGMAFTSFAWHVEVSTRHMHVHCARNW